MCCVWLCCVVCFGSGLCGFVRALPFSLFSFLPSHPFLTPRQPNQTTTEGDWADDGTTATTPTNKGDKAKGAGRYKCRYCGGIKRQHVCPALIDIPRASTGTQVDLPLTMGQGACYYVLLCCAVGAVVWCSVVCWVGCRRGTRGDGSTTPSSRTSRVNRPRRLTHQQPTTTQHTLYNKTTP